MHESCTSKREMEEIMKRNKLLQFFSATLLAAMLLSACGSSVPNSSADTSAGTTGQSSAQEGTGQTEISFSFWGNQEEIDNKLALVAEFEKQNPDIKIKPVYTDGGQYQTKLQTWFSSGDTPDAMGIAGDIIYDYVKTGMFEDLTPRIENDGLQDSWAESASQNFVYDGKQYGLPHIYHVYCITYNKKLFDEAGLAYPTQDWTLDDFTTMAQALTKGEGSEKVYGLGGYGAYGANEYIHVFGDPTYGWEDGFTIFPNGTDGFVKGLEFFGNMINVDQTTPGPDSDANDIGFDSGRFGMYIAAPWWISTWQTQIGDNFEWDLVTFPKVEGGAWYARVFPNGMGIPAASQHKDEAWRLIKWLCADEEAQAIASKTGMPNLTSYATSDEFKNTLEPGWKPYNKQAFVDALEHTWMTQNTGIFDQINTIVYNEFPNYLSGNLTAEAFIEKIEAKGSEIAE